MQIFVLALALLFAPVLFGLELIQNAPDLGFSFEVMNGDRPEIIIFDYAGSLQNSAIQFHAVINKPQTIQTVERIYRPLVKSKDPTEDPKHQEAGNREGVGKVYCRATA